MSKPIAASPFAPGDFAVPVTAVMADAGGVLSEDQALQLMARAARTAAWTRLLAEVVPAGGEAARLPAPPREGELLRLRAAVVDADQGAVTVRVTGLCGPMGCSTVRRAIEAVFHFTAAESAFAAPASIRKTQRNTPA